ncbi:hypothetical protein KC19_2G226300 [Ceratodon purpureus]|uniref:Uncharacterized protein n=1 Tax=Ceratodon purpureus TaxID=3225 RepID=A0A8T0IWX5_CERPU|nr:hypothetical protein KC19_2G226300 [Ceratodon purpureus]
MGRNSLKTYGLLRRSEFRNYEGACNAHSLGWNILGLTIALTFFLCVCEHLFSINSVTLLNELRQIGFLNL